VAKAIDEALGRERPGWRAIIKQGLSAIEESRLWRRAGPYKGRRLYAY
jgi:hypothetical protein